MYRKNKKHIIIRKNIFKHLIAFALVFTSIASFAQDQKTLFQQWGEVPIQQYLVSGTKGNYSYMGITSDKYEIKFLKMEDPYLWGIKLDAEKDYLREEFHADHNAYAVTLYESGIRHPSLKYLMSNPKSNDQRFLVIDNYIYLLEEWKDKNDYKIKKIFMKGRLKGIKYAKEMVAAKKKMEAANHKERLQKYLDKEYAIQSQKIPSWNKTHATYVNAVKTEKINFEKRIKGEREDFNRMMAKRRGSCNKSSSSSKSSTSGKMVRVSTSNKGSHGNIRVYWKEGGNWKSSGFSSGYSGSVTVPAGAQLYYVENNSAKKPFYSAPSSGSGSYQF